MTDRAQTRSMIARVEGDCVVFVHTHEPPTDREWDRVLDFFRVVDGVGPTRALIYTMGAAPNAAQRARLIRQEIASPKVRVAAK